MGILLPRYIFIVTMEGKTSAFCDESYKRVVEVAKAASIDAPHDVYIHRFILQADGPRLLPCRKYRNGENIAGKTKGAT